MKSLTRTIIVLVVLNLTMGNFVLAQAEVSAESTDRRQTPATPPPEPAPPVSVSPAPAPPVPVPPEPTPAAPTLPAPTAPSPYPTQARSTGYISSRKILVIPAKDIEAEDLDAITQDLQVMSHIFDERFKEPRTIKGVFTDFGDFFGRDNRATEAIYLQGYGALFLMEVNFSFSPPSKSQEKETKKTEDVDPIWQRARQQIFSPKGFGGGKFVSEERYSAEKIDQLKTELIETLQHAANIRNLTPDEWIILTVIGHGRQPGEFYEDYYRSAAPRSRTSRDRRSSRGEAEAGAYGGGMGGGMSMGMGGMMGGMGSMGGYGGGMGGYGGGMMGGYGEMMGGMAGYGEMGLPSATVLTIRAKKSDVDDFAKGELDFEQFQQTVEIFTY